jgi:hypothetical protein
MSTENPSGKVIFDTASFGESSGPGSSARPPEGSKNKKAIALRRRRVGLRTFIGWR